MAGASHKEVNAALKKAFAIPGMYRRRESEFLYRLARRKGELVEIGCWMGRTTCILVQAAKPWQAKVTTIDNFTTTQPGVPIPATAEKWRKHLLSVKLQPPTLFEMPSMEAVALYDSDISLLFIDSDHSYKAVKDDLAAWAPKVKLGGYLLLHDMFYPSVDGVCRAVVDWWLKEKWEIMGQADFTIAFKRTK